MRRGDESLCSLVIGRQHGRYFHSPRPFERGVVRSFKQKQYLREELEIVSPHRKAVSCLSLDEGSGRFLLAGSADATISLYDISKWGSEHFVQNGASSKARNHSFHPVARTMKVRERNTTTTGSSLEERMATTTTPAGHSFSLSHVQWFPTDTGAFISTSIDGSCLLWDTNQMEPVLYVRPFDDSTFGSAHLQTGGDHSLLAACSWNDSSLKLVDVRSGSHSHQLTGHGDGITQVQWSPTNSVILASGSRDGTVRLWDIRKSGSRACITILDREASPSKGGGLIPPYAGDYSHLRPSMNNTNSRQQKNSKSSKMRKRNIAPNNYDLIQNTGKRSHSRGGYVAGLQFFPDGQRLASVGGPDGELLVWDLRLGVLEPSKFIAPGGLTTGVCTIPSRSTRRAAICIEKDGSIIWVGRYSTILGFAIDGGSPVQVLNGHLHNVCSIDRMDPVRNLLSGSQEGMVLCWGRPKTTNVGHKRRMQAEDRDNW